MPTTSGQPNESVSRMLYVWDSYSYSRIASEMALITGPHPTMTANVSIDTYETSVDIHATKPFDPSAQSINDTNSSVCGAFFFTPTHHSTTRSLSHSDPEQSTALDEIHCHHQRAFFDRRELQNFIMIWLTFQNNLRSNVCPP